MRRPDHDSVSLPGIRRGLLIAASLSATMALSPVLALADEYGITNTQVENAPVVQTESVEATP